MWSGSLSLRLFALTSIFAVIAVAAIALVLSELYRVNAERRFAELLTANLYNLMGSVETGDEGRLTGRPNLGDPRFSRFGSGWYWWVGQVGNQENRLASASLSDDVIPEPQGIPFDASFQRLYQYEDRGGRLLTVAEAQVYLGTGDDIYSFRVTGNRDEIDAEIASFVQRLIMLLALFALGFIAASYGIVRLGLRPILRATQRLADIREGRAEKLEGSFPREIRPFIDEANSLIVSNRAVVERARTQVGNLAHSLKTPLAVLRNEAANAPSGLGRLIREQTGLMQDQVENYLNRARIAARHGTITSLARVRPVTERLVRVIGKLNPELEIGSVFETDLAFAGESQDLEEILGNLLENAARFARTKIVLTVREITSGQAPEIEIDVEDDGPGMKAEQAEIALRRGARLDESTPGSGLGLSIVNDIVREYQGSLAFHRAQMGGLGARVRLPARRG
jgi:signal transduction histidine kinase